MFEDVGPACGTKRTSWTSSAFPPCDELLKSVMEQEGIDSRRLARVIDKKLKADEGKNGAGNDGGGTVAP